MIRIKNMADHMVVTAEIVITAIAGILGAMNDSIVGFLAKATPLTAGLKNIGTVWFDMIKFVAQIAMGFFLMCSIYLPMVPFIIFMGQILNWLITVVEGVAAAPFLAFAHLDTDGEGLGHKTQYGYVFMLQSFMRPVMLVLGFLFACLLLEAIGGYVMQIYPIVIANVQMDSVTGFFSILGFTAIFFVIMVGLVNTCFSVTYLLPDAIFTFIGAQSSATSQAGRNEDRSVRDSSMGGAAISRQMQTGLDKKGAKERGEKAETAGRGEVKGASDRE